MSDKTTNYGLTKPLSTDYYDIEIQNGNMEIIDDQLKALDSGKESLIKNAAAKTSLVDGDAIPLSDSADLSKTKKISWANAKVALKAYFDTFYNKVIIANTLTETTTGKALDATQGKALNDLVSNISGFSDKTTVFDADGSITETREDGSVFVTSFHADGSITETLTKGSIVKKKTTTFNANGSISEVIS